jgi:hypothetical protein
MLTEVATGIDWDEIHRHWWRYDAQHQAMVHRVSGEMVLSVGPFDMRNLPGSAGSASRSERNDGWHRFEYVFEGERYPILVHIFRVASPNPLFSGIEEPERFTEDKIWEPSIWRVDHVRSAALWRKEHNDAPEELSFPSYSLWRRADRAICDAALLWPRDHPGLPTADQAAVNGGWSNGTWREEFYRLLRPAERWRGRHPAKSQLQRSPDLFAAPLSQYTTESSGSEPNWAPADVSTGMAMGNDVDGSILTLSDGDAKRPGKHLVLTSVSRQFQVPCASLGDRWKLGGEPAAQFGPNATWVVRMNDRSAIALPLRIHPLQSYELGQWLYEQLLNALPHSPGFEALGTTSQRKYRQGNCGRVVIQGGFIGGIQSLVTEIRLKLQQPGDRRILSDTLIAEYGPSTDWLAFFQG